jgi:hypothetical protein
MSARTWEDGLISPNRGAGGLTVHAMPLLVSSGWAHYP